MPFNSNTQNLLNKTVFAYPVTGYGWQLTNENGFERIEPPRTFQFRLLEFFYADNQPTVACGRIVEPDHEFSHFWVTLVAIIDDAQLALDKDAGPCGTLICSEKPSFDSSIRPVNLAKVVRTSSTPRYSGISVASLSLELVLKNINK